VHRHVTKLAAGGFALLACGGLVGCGTSGPFARVVVRRPPGHRLYVGSGSQASITAAGSAGPDGWALTNDGLDVTRDGGQDWTNLPLPPASASAIAISVLASETVVVAPDADDTALVVDTYSSAGGQWQAQQVPVDLPVGAAQIVDAAGTLAGIMVTAQTGAGFSEGAWLGTSDGGGTWQEHLAPSGGDAIANDGQLWLSGGVGASSLYRSSDAGETWQKVVVPTTLDQQQLVALGPVELTPNGFVVTATDSSQTQVITGSTSGSLSDGPTLSLGGQYGPGAPAESSQADDVLWVVSPVNQVARVNLSTGQVSTVDASGLPTNGTLVLDAISPTTAWASYTTNACQTKTACLPESGVLETTDGGASWQEMSVTGTSTGTS